MTDTYELPPLPEKHQAYAAANPHYVPPPPPRWTDDDMQEYARLAIRRGRELSEDQTREYVRASIEAERERAEGYREALAMIAAQGSANPGSTSRVDCMAALAAAIRKG